MEVARLVFFGGTATPLVCPGCKTVSYTHLDVYKRQLLVSQNEIGRIGFVLNLLHYALVDFVLRVNLMRNVYLPVILSVKLVDKRFKTVLVVAANYRGQFDI